MKRELGYASFLFLLLGACSVPTGDTTESSATKSAEVTASAQPAGATGLPPVSAMQPLSDVFVPTTFLWHNGTTGATQNWTMQGATRATFKDVDALLNVTDSTGWRVVSMDDFNGDGAADILWHNGVSGASQVWYMNGATRLTFASFDAKLNVKDESGWRPVGTGDFNHDGKVDILWHNGISVDGGTPGGSQVWYMDGASRLDFANLDTGLSVADDTGWIPVGVSDIDLDGNPDIVWHNVATGATQEWFMASGGVARRTFLQVDAAFNVPASTGWNLVAVY